MSKPQCIAKTAKGAQCSKTAQYGGTSKMYCYVHCPPEFKPSEPITGRKTVTKTASPPARSQPSAVNDDDEPNEESFEDVVCDLSNSRNSGLHPSRIQNVSFQGFNFMNAEQAYHFMKFYYPGKEGQVGADKRVEILRSILNSKIDDVREIAQNNSSLIDPNWKKSDGSGVTMGERVMFSILNAAADRTSSLYQALTSVMSGFEDSENAVTNYVPNYDKVLKVLSNYVRA